MPAALALTPRGAPPRLSSSSTSTSMPRRPSALVSADSLAATARRHGLKSRHATATPDPQVQSSGTAPLERGEIRDDYRAQGLTGRDVYRAFGCPELRRRGRKDDGGSGPSRGWCGGHGSGRLLGRRGGGVDEWSTGRGVAGALGQPLRRRSLWRQFHPEDLGLVVHDDVAVWSERDPAPVAVGQFLQRIQHHVWKVPYPLGRGVLGHLTSKWGRCDQGGEFSVRRPAGLRSGVRRRYPQATCPLVPGGERPQGVPRVKGA
jgi:hypothetical protein